MNLNRSFEALCSFLRRHEALWSAEVITRYPSEAGVFPEAWIEFLATLEEEALYDLQCGRIAGLPASLRDYFEEAHELAQLPDAERSASSTLPASMFWGIKDKKQHEITRLCCALSFIFGTSSFSGVLSGVLDFCGGAGFVAQGLSQTLGVRLVSLDHDEVLQNKGRKRKSGRFPDLPVEFVHTDILGESLLDITATHRDFLSLGLHTCGSLADAQLTASSGKRMRAVLNFGCCYYRLGETSLRPIGMNGASNGAGAALHLTRPALTLASRAHKDSESSYRFSRQVRLYRYMMHLFLHQELEMHSFVGLGNSTKALYQRPFADYGIEQLRRIGKQDFPAAENRLSAFFSHPANQHAVKRMIIANTIRSAAGRPLEVALLLHRALLLEAQGYSVSLAHYFDDRISPRNIGILGTL